MSAELTPAMVNKASVSPLGLDRIQQLINQGLDARAQTFDDAWRKIQADQVSQTAVVR